ncbi:MAG: polyprenol monophosphomannose synthase [Candidatus Omnitrophica bacterium]|nr:polyprenol monophosphomannose synthase [Candidatus Omnitrophota bacterium]
MKTLAIIPTYNEKENLAELIPCLFTSVPDIHLLVVDDNSPDGTGRFVQEMALQDPRIFLLSRPAKEGLGRAYVAGFQWALARGYDVMITLDGDMSHHPSYIPAMLNEISQADLVVGSRWIQGGGIRDWSLYRVLLSRGASLYARLVLGLAVKDLTGGFNCYRRSVLEAVGPKNIHADGYGFQIEMKYRALQQGFRLKEVPIVFPDRQKGKSKISRRIVLEAIVLVWKLRLSPARLPRP